MPYINLNGAMYPEHEPVFTTANRSFRYGDGFFESIMIKNGSCPLQDLHLERIKESMAILEMDGGAELIQKVKIALPETIKLNENVNGRARITIFRNDGGFYTPENSTSSFVIATDEMSNISTLNVTGLKTAVFKSQPKSRGPLSAIKSTSSLLYVMAGKFCHDKNLDDCMIINESGNFIETGKANVFLVKAGIVYTPSIEEGCVNGVMRRHLIELINKGGSKVIEGAIDPEFASTCQEMFTTSAVYGIRWVQSCGPLLFTNDISIVLHRKLSESLQQ